MYHVLIILCPHSPSPHHIKVLTSETQLIEPNSIRDRYDLSRFWFLFLDFWKIVVWGRIPSRNRHHLFLVAHTIRSVLVAFYCNKFYKSNISATIRSRISSPCGKLILDHLIQIISIKIVCHWIHGFQRIGTIFSKNASSNYLIRILAMNSIKCKKIGIFHRRRRYRRRMFLFILFSN